MAGRGPFCVPKRNYPSASSANAPKPGAAPTRTALPNFATNEHTPKQSFPQKRTYAQVLKQQTPKWLLYTSKQTVYKRPQNNISEDERRRRAKEKYGKGFRPEPPKRNRRVWEHFLAHNMKLAKENYQGCSKNVLKVLRERGIAWQNHPQGSMQQNLLTGEAGFYQKGVIYALVNQDNWFHVKFPVYVGQTSGHVVERAQRHMDKANDASTQNLEPKIFEAMRNTKRWWQKLVMIPLESVPLPTDCQPGTQQFLKKVSSKCQIGRAHV